MNFPSRAGLKWTLLPGALLVDESFCRLSPGIFACGNVVTVYDLVDYVTQSGETAGKGAALFARGKLPPPEPLTCRPGENCAFIVPHALTPERCSEQVNLYLRVKETMKSVRITVKSGSQVLASKREKIVSRDNGRS